MPLGWRALDGLVAGTVTFAILLIASLTYPGLAGVLGSASLPPYILFPALALLATYLFRRVKLHVRRYDEPLVYPENPLTVTTPTALGVAAAVAAIILAALAPRGAALGAAAVGMLVAAAVYGRHYWKLASLYRLRVEDYEARVKTVFYTYALLLERQGYASAAEVEAITSQVFDDDIVDGFVVALKPYEQLAEEFTWKVNWTVGFKCLTPEPFGVLRADPACMDAIRAVRAEIEEEPCGSFLCRYVERVKAVVKIADYRWKEFGMRTSWTPGSMGGGTCCAEPADTMFDVFDEGDRIVVVAELPDATRRPVVEVQEHIVVIDTGNGKVWVPLPRRAPRGPARVDYRNGVVEIVLEEPGSAPGMRGKL